MKYKTTRKQIEYGYRKIFQAGYCELYPLDRYFETVAYNAGVYGWNFDVIAIGNIAITTGYRGMFGRDLPEKADRILRNAKKYNEKNGIPYEKKEKYMLNACRKFEKALKEA